MKKKKIIIILFCIIILIYIGIRLVSNILVNHANSISVSSLNMENVNGTYISEYFCIPVFIKVKVIVKNQSLGIDTVSGATVSSKRILKAVENVIERGNS